MSDTDKEMEPSLFKLARKASAAWSRVVLRVKETVGDEESDKYIETRFGYWAPRKDVDRAFELFKAVLAADPENVLIRFDMAQALVFLGRFEEAKCDLDWVSNFVGDDFKATRTAALYLLARGTLERGRLAEAKEYADRYNAAIVEGRLPHRLFDVEKERREILESDASV